MNYTRLPLVSLIARLGVAFAFVYPAIDEIFVPSDWIGYFPQFILNSGIPQTVILHSFGALEIVLALWLVWGKRAYIPAAIMTLMLVAIVGFNLASFEVVFRDLSIAAASLALAVLYWPVARSAS